MSEHLWDVVAVEIKPPNKERIMKRGLTEKNAEAFISIAVARRGVSEEFYTKKPTGYAVQPEGRTK